MKAFAVLALFALVAAACAQAPAPQKADAQPSKDLKGSEAVYVVPPYAAYSAYAAPAVATYGYSPYAYAAAPYAYASPYAYSYLYR